MKTYFKYYLLILWAPQIQFLCPPLFWGGSWNSKMDVSKPQQIKQKPQLVGNFSRNDSLSQRNWNIYSMFDVSGDWIHMWLIKSTGFLYTYWTYHLIQDCWELASSVWQIMKCTCSDIVIYSSSDKPSCPPSLPPGLVSILVYFTRKPDLIRWHTRQSYDIPSRLTNSPWNLKCGKTANTQTKKLF